MENLNELVEQAKFVADWHGSDWSSALCQDKDGKQAHKIICESRGEVVISTGSNSNEASWLCDYLELCSPANILAIAAAFRQLEQRAEAAEAKLAELGKQESQTIFALTDKNTGVLEQLSGDDVYFNQEDAEREVARRKRDYQEDYAITAFTNRTSPAADLAELVPDARPDLPDHYSGDIEYRGMCDGWNSCRAAILRNIEKAR